MSLHPVLTEKLSVAMAAEAQPAITRRILPIPPAPPVFDQEVVHIRLICKVDLERFFRSLKEECVCQHTFQTFEEARQIIRDWVQWCNQERPHQAFGYRRLVLPDIDR